MKNSWFYKLLLGVITFPVFATASSVETPAFNYATGTYNAPFTVTISCATPGAAIFYTIDGSEPTQESIQYDGVPVLVWKHASGNVHTGQSNNDPSADDETYPLTFSSLTLKAVAVKDGMENSAVVEAVYVLDLVEASLNIAYDDPPEAGGGKHLLDIYQPAGKSGTPVLFFVHGGAWMQGDKNIYLELGNTFSGYYGLTTVTVNYQLSSDPWNVKHPTHVQDVAKAFAWVKENIEAYGGDPNHINVFGQSAGAHLVSLLATDNSYLEEYGLGYNDIDRVIAMSGAYNLSDFSQFPLNPLELSALEVTEYKTLFLNAFGGWDQAVLDSGSPGYFINNEQPPIHLIALNETETFKDMPGFGADANQFQTQIQNLGGPVVTLERLSESDIDKSILDIEFSVNTDGHYEEIYSINTPLWNSVSSQLVAGYVNNKPDIPVLLSPVSGSEISDENITFTWDVCRAAIYYELQIARNDEFGDENILWNGPVAQNKMDLSGLEHGAAYFWRMRSVNGLGVSDWSEPSSFACGETTGISVLQSVPHSFNMQPYPNPFNGAVMLQISVPEGAIGPGRLMIYNLTGRLVENRSLDLHPGTQTVRWRPSSSIPSGLYFFRINVGPFSCARKAMYVK